MTKARRISGNRLSKWLIILGATVTVAAIGLGIALDGSAAATALSIGAVAGLLMIAAGLVYYIMNPVRRHA